MWDEERPTEELLDQIAATRAALSSLAVAVVRATAAQRLTAAPTAPAASASSDNFEGVLDLVDRLLRSR